jgi:hypothetical protein
MVVGALTPIAASPIVGMIMLITETETAITETLMIIAGQVTATTIIPK